MINFYGNVLKTSREGSKLLGNTCHKHPVIIKVELPVDKLKQFEFKA